VVRALLLHQPDRSLRADWGGAPVLVRRSALQATGLVQPFSRVEYRYRVRTESRGGLARRLRRRLPGAAAEVRTVDDRSDRIAEVLGQIGSGLLLVGFSALFIGGLGVFNSVQAYLQGKLGTLATLRALGLRDARLAAVVLLQVLMLALGASLAGALLGGALALGGVALAGRAAAAGAGLAALAAPLAVAVAFGVLTALCFALPALGRALSVTPAALFRGIDGQCLRTPRSGLVAHALALRRAAGGHDGAVAAGRWCCRDRALFGLAFVAVALAAAGLLERRAARCCAPLAPTGTGEPWRRIAAGWRLASSCAWRWPGCSGRARRCARRCCRWARR
jgi:putative ABC transport system permease protein